MKKTILPIIIIFICSSNFIIAGIEDDLVAHWTFDNDTGTKVVDVSGNRFNGTSYNASYENGPVGQAIVFDNPDDAVHIPSLGAAPPEQVSRLAVGSISLWFKYQSIGGQILPILYFGESCKDSAHNSLIIEIGHGGTPNNRRLYFTLVHQRFCYDSGINTEENKWYHFVAVVSPEGNTGYLNGVEMINRHYNLGSDSSYSDFFANVQKKEMMSIGFGRYGQDDNFYSFKGSIDDIRIYDRPLTPAEVRQLYQLGDLTEENPPTYENVAYGSDERNILDFWQAESDGPAPVVIFIHGGGFKSGSKEQARSGRQLDYLKRCLENGVSFAAINYRYRQTTRLDTIMLDCARAVQFIRSKADEWNIRKDRIASFGGSAGGGATIWLAFHDDLADPGSGDPVLRESTRLTVCGHLNSQATYDFAKWPEILGVSENWMEDFNSSEDLELYHIESREQYNDPEIIKLRAFLDMPSFLDEEDPPIFFQNLNQNTIPQSSGHLIHHPKHAIYLKELADSLGIDNEIDLAVTPPADKPDMLDFFFKYLLDGQSSVENRKENLINIYPNPASEYITIESSESFSIDIYDSFGRNILSKDIHHGMHKYHLNLTKFSNGVYTIFFNNGSVCISKNFMVLK